MQKAEIGFLNRRSRVRVTPGPPAITWLNSVLPPSAALAARRLLAAFDIDAEAAGNLHPTGVAEGGALAALSAGFVLVVGTGTGADLLVVLLRRQHLREGERIAADQTRGREKSEQCRGDARCPVARAGRPE